MASVPVLLTEGKGTVSGLIMPNSAPQGDPEKVMRDHVFQALGLTGAIGRCNCLL